MKRDMDLVREILKELAESDNSLDARVFTDETKPFQLVAYHFEIMGEAGLITTSISKPSSGDYTLAIAKRLTWEGNDFLSAVSNKGVWKATKKRIAKTLGDASFGMVKDLAIKIGSKVLFD